VGQATDEELADYIFYEEDNENNIIFHENGKIKGATLGKLVERATYEKYPGTTNSKNIALSINLTSLKTDPDFLASFLLTYRSFTTPTELMDLLIIRYKAHYYFQISLILSF